MIKNVLQTIILYIVDRIRVLVPLDDDGMNILFVRIQFL